MKVPCEKLIFFFVNWYSFFCKLTTIIATFVSVFLFLFTLCLCFKMKRTSLAYLFIAEVPLLFYCCFSSFSHTIQAEQKLTLRFEISSVLLAIIKNKINMPP